MLDYEKKFQCFRNLWKKNKLIAVSLFLDRPEFHIPWNSNAHV